MPLDVLGNGGIHQPAVGPTINRSLRDMPEVDLADASKRLLSWWMSWILSELHVWEGRTPWSRPCLDLVEEQAPHDSYQSILE